MSNQLVIQMAKDLKKASKENDAPIWSKMAKQALKPSSARKTININKVGKVTKENDVVVFPGKVLGTGNISHKITLCSFTISNTAADKIIESGGKLINYKEMVEQYPTGKGVTLLGQWASSKNRSANCS